ncbi:hypothetical protein [Endozoicomonas ascidiicola]|uniref:hypothetical protein n=1 Tax=Endozoicomonas ascidiicola TaxID=1698521 RepID=UPI000A969AE6|nr:hypothetical protein [Endozoicomonas ascidiicola]
MWEGRYKSQALLDEAALLTCMAYVDLNPVRAKTPETSEYTSIKERAGSYCSTGTTRRQPSFLKPFKAPGQNPDLAIPYALSCYLELVDWSGRIFRKDKRGRILETVPPILLRLNIDPEEWLKTIRWNNRFRRVMGTLPALKNHAVQTGKRWVHGMSVSRRLFLSEASNRVVAMV